MFDKISLLIKIVIAVSIIFIIVNYLIQRPKIIEMATGIANGFISNIEMEEDEDRELYMNLRRRYIADFEKNLKSTMITNAVIFTIGAYFTLNIIMNNKTQKVSTNQSSSPPRPYFGSNY